mmetsp:Transcript_8455/g.16620  ORF Transcript_8455/g.16620 Transcript_8455/m.16620 type:complete len:154 (-) Transcript_8455:19-480(-)
MDGCRTQAGHQVKLKALEEASTQKRTPVFAGEKGRWRWYGFYRISILESFSWEEQAAGSLPPVARVHFVREECESKDEERMANAIETARAALVASSDAAKTTAIERNSDEGEEKSMKGMERARRNNKRKSTEKKVSVERQTTTTSTKKSRRRM